jgi:PIN domain nuclease of toxin-antitoxin system
LTPKALVTDTHPLIYYFCTDQRKLSSKAKRAFEDARNAKAKAIYVPTPVLWELSMLVQDNKIQLKQSFEQWVKSLFKHPMVIEQTLDSEIIIECHGLMFTDDPFDRMIVATANHLGLPLITNDAAIHSAQPCDIFWD